jgi:hypothetical protein
MAMLIIGDEEGDHVSINLPNGKIDEDGWFVAEVDIVVGGFRGHTAVYFEISDIIRFHKSLIPLYDSLSGTAILNPIEQQLTLNISGAGRGKMDVTGELFAYANYGSRLQFEFTIDQTYLPRAVRAIGEFLAH